MKTNHFNLLKKLFVVILLGLLGLPVFGQTEEQKKHPKYAELLEHYNSYKVANQIEDYDNALIEAQKALDIGKEIFGEEDLTTAAIYNNLGQIYTSKGEYEKAIQYIEKSLTIQLKTVGENHSDVATSYNNLGNVYHSKGAYDTAVEYYTKSLGIWISTIGEMHPTLATSYNNLGEVYRAKGEDDKAIEYHNKSLDIKLKVLGETNMDVAISYNNLGLVYDSKGESDKAIEYHNKSLDIKLKVLGENHPSVATSYNSIGSVYRSKGESDKAMEYHNKSLKIKLKVLGENHPSVATSYYSIGNVYHDKGEYDKAIEYHNKSLEIKLKVLGENHPDTASSYNNLGEGYRAKGEYDKAIEYHNKSLGIKLKVLGENYPNVASSYNNLGQVYSSKGDFDKAIEYFNKSLVINLKVFGENHHRVASNYNNLGGAYLYKGEFDRAIDYFQKDSAIQLKAFGEDHPNMATNYNNLGVVYSQKGENDKAIQYHNKSLRITLKIFGEDHPSTAQSYINLGAVYSEKKDYDMAMEYFNKSLRIILKIHGEEHPDTAHRYGWLGVVYGKKGDYSKAIDYLNKSLKIDLKILGEQHPDIARIYNALGTAHKFLKDYDKAIDYHQKAISILEKSGDRFGHVNSYLNLRDVYKAQKNTEMKIFVLKEAMELVLKYRTEMGKDKEYFTQKFYSVFEELLDVYMQSEQFDRALEISEKMRGLSLSENFNLKYALTNGGAPVDKAEKMLGLRKELEGLYSQRLVALQKTDEVGRQISNRLWNEISTRENELNAIDKELMQKPIYARLRKLNSPTITDLQTDARKVGKTFLEYNLIHKDGKEELHVSVITPDLFRHLNLGKDTDLTRKVNNLRKIISEYPDSRKFILLKNKDGKEILCTYSECKGFEKGREYFVQELDLKDSFKEDNKKKYIQKLVGTQERKIDVEEANRIMDSLLKELYAIIIKPIEKAGLLKSKSIVISPDSTLFTVPFSALKNAEGKYAIEEYEISLIHSASIWERLVRKEPLKFTKPFFAMGNSVYGIGHDDTRGVKGKRGLRSMEKDLRSLTDMSDIDTMRMNNLPGSLEEIKEISRMAYEKEIEPEHIFLGIRANKEELYKKFEKPINIYRSVHFSVHGLFFMDSPEMNSLAFTSRERAVKFREEDLKEYEKKNGEIKKDGFFKLGETIELGIKTDLLVMSACETSLGTEKAGEGMVGLPQGFLMGGANNVLATLWSVDDKGTMNFMKEFYSPFFKKNLSPANALRNAQKVLSAKASKEDKYKDPFYWSPFVVYGK